MSNKRYYICVTPFFPTPGNWRGAYVFDQVKAIERQSDYRVLVFVPCGFFEKPSSFKIDGLTVHRIPCLQMPSYFFNGMSGGLNGQSLIRRLKAIHIDPDDIAVCHCHTAGFACFATAIKHLNPHVKTVLQYHDLDPFQIRCGKFATWRPNVTYRVKKFTSQFKNIDLHLCISEHTRYNLGKINGINDSKNLKAILFVVMALCLSIQQTKITLSEQEDNQLNQAPLG